MKLSFLATPLRSCQNQIVIDISDPGYDYSGGIARPDDDSSRRRVSSMLVVNVRDPGYDFLPEATTKASHLALPGEAAKTNWSEEVPATESHAHESQKRPKRNRKEEPIRAAENLQTMALKGSPVAKRQLGVGNRVIGRKVRLPGWRQQENEKGHLHLHSGTSTANLTSTGGAKTLRIIGEGEMANNNENSGAVCSSISNSSKQSIEQVNSPADTMTASSSGESDEKLCADETVTLAMEMPCEANRAGIESLNMTDDDKIELQDDCSDSSLIMRTPFRKVSKLRSTLETDVNTLLEPSESRIRSPSLAEIDMEDIQALQLAISEALEEFFRNIDPSVDLRKEYILKREINGVEVEIPLLRGTSDDSSCESSCDDDNISLITLHLKTRDRSASTPYNVTVSTEVVPKSKSRTKYVSVGKYFAPIRNAQEPKRNSVKVGIKAKDKLASNSSVESLPSIHEQRSKTSLQRTNENSLILPLSESKCVKSRKQSSGLPIVSSDFDHNAQDSKSQKYQDSATEAKNQSAAEFYSLAISGSNMACDNGIIQKGARSVGSKSDASCSVASSASTSSMLVSEVSCHGKGSSFKTKPGIEEARHAGAGSTGNRLHKQNRSALREGGTVSDARAKSKDARVQSTLSKAIMRTIKLEENALKARRQEFQDRRRKFEEVNCDNDFPLRECSNMNIRSFSLPRLAWEASFAKRKLTGSTELLPDALEDPRELEVRTPSLENRCRYVSSNTNQQKRKTSAVPFPADNTSNSIAHTERYSESRGVYMNHKAKRDFISAKRTEEEVACSFDVHENYATDTYSKGSSTTNLAENGLRHLKVRSQRVADLCKVYDSTPNILAYHRLTVVNNLASPDGTDSHSCSTDYVAVNQHSIEGSPRPVVDINTSAMNYDNSDINSLQLKADACSKLLPGQSNEVSDWQACKRLHATYTPALAPSEDDDDKVRRSLLFCSDGLNSVESSFASAKPELNSTITMPFGTTEPLQHSIEMHSFDFCDSVMHSDTDSQLIYYLSKNGGERDGIVESLECSETTISRSLNSSSFDWDKFPALGSKRCGATDLKYLKISIFVEELIQNCFSEVFRQLRQTPHWSYDRHGRSLGRACSSDFEWAGHDNQVVSNLPMDPSLFRFAVDSKAFVQGNGEFTFHDSHSYYEVVAEDIAKQILRNVFHEIAEADAQVVAEDIAKQILRNVFHEISAKRAEGDLNSTSELFRSSPESVDNENIQYLKTLSYSSCDDMFELGYTCPVCNTVIRYDGNEIKMPADISHESVKITDHSLCPGDICTACFSSSLSGPSVIAVHGTRYQRPTSTNSLHFPNKSQTILHHHGSKSCEQPDILQNSVHLLTTFAEGLQSNSTDITETNKTGFEAEHISNDQDDATSMDTFKATAVVASEITSIAADANAMIITNEYSTNEPVANKRNSTLQRQDFTTNTPESKICDACILEEIPLVTPHERFQQETHVKYQYRQPLGNMTSPIVYLEPKDTADDIPGAKSAIGLLESVAMLTDKPLTCQDMPRDRSAGNVSSVVHTETFLIRPDDTSCLPPHNNNIINPSRTSIAVPMEAVASGYSECVIVGTELQLAKVKDENVARDEPFLVSHGALSDAEETSLSSCPGTEIIHLGHVAVEGLRESFVSLDRGTQIFSIERPVLILDKTSLVISGEMIADTLASSSVVSHETAMIRPAYISKNESQETPVSLCKEIQFFVANGDEPIATRTASPDIKSEAAVIPPGHIASFSSHATAELASTNVTFRSLHKTAVRFYNEQDLSVKIEEVRNTQGKTSHVFPHETTAIVVDEGSAVCSQQPSAALAESSHDVTAILPVPLDLFLSVRDAEIITSKTKSSLESDNTPLGTNRSSFICGNETTLIAKSEISFAPLIDCALEPNTVPNDHSLTVSAEWPSFNDASTPFLPHEPEIFTTDYVPSDIVVIPVLENYLHVFHAADATEADGTSIHDFQEPCLVSLDEVSKTLANEIPKISVDKSTNSAHENAQIDDSVKASCAATQEGACTSCPMYGKNSVHENAKIASGEVSVEALHAVIIPYSVSAIAPRESTMTVSVESLIFDPPQLPNLCPEDSFRGLPESAMLSPGKCSVSQGRPDTKMNVPKPSGASVIVAREASMATPDGTGSALNYSDESFVNVLRDLTIINGSAAILADAISIAGLRERAAMNAGEISLAPLTEQSENMINEASTNTRWEPIMLRYNLAIDNAQSQEIYIIPARESDAIDPIAAVRLSKDDPFPLPTDTLMIVDGKYSIDSRQETEANPSDKSACFDNQPLNQLLSAYANYTSVDTKVLIERNAMHEDPFVIGSDSIAAVGKDTALICPNQTPSSAREGCILEPDINSNFQHSDEASSTDDNKHWASNATANQPYDQVISWLATSHAQKRTVIPRDLIPEDSSKIALPLEPSNSAQAKVIAGLMPSETAVFDIYPNEILDVKGTASFDQDETFSYIPYGENACGKGESAVKNNQVSAILTTSQGSVELLQETVPMTTEGGANILPQQHFCNPATPTAVSFHVRATVEINTDEIPPSGRIEDSGVCPCSPASTMRLEKCATNSSNESATFEWNNMDLHFIDDSLAELHEETAAKACTIAHPKAASLIAVEDGICSDRSDCPWSADEAFADYRDEAAMISQVESPCHESAEMGLRVALIDDMKEDLSDTGYEISISVLKDATIADSCIVSFLPQHEFPQLSSEDTVDTKGANLSATNKGIPGGLFEVTKTSENDSLALTLNKATTNTLIETPLSFSVNTISTGTQSQTFKVASLDIANAIATDPQDCSYTSGTPKLNLMPAKAIRNLFTLGTVTIAEDSSTIASLLQSQVKVTAATSLIENTSLTSYDSAIFEESGNGSISLRKSLSYLPGSNSCPENECFSAALTTEENSTAAAFEAAAITTLQNIYLISNWHLTTTSDMNPYAKVFDEPPIFPAQQNHWLSLKKHPVAGIDASDSDGVPQGLSMVSPSQTSQTTTRAEAIVPREIRSSIIPLKCATIPGATHGQGALLCMDDRFRLAVYSVLRNFHDKCISKEAQDYSVPLPSSTHINYDCLQLLSHERCVLTASRKYNHHPVAGDSCVQLALENLTPGYPIEYANSDQSGSNTYALPECFKEAISSLNTAEDPGSIKEHNEVDSSLTRDDDFTVTMNLTSDSSELDTFRTLLESACLESLFDLHISQEGGEPSEEDRSANIVPSSSHDLRCSLSQDFEIRDESSKVNLSVNAATSDSRRTSALQDLCKAPDYLSLAACSQAELHPLRVETLCFSDITLQAMNKLLLKIFAQRPEALLHKNSNPTGFFGTLQQYGSTSSTAVSVMSVPWTGNFNVNEPANIKDSSVSKNSLITSRGELRAEKSNAPNKQAKSSAFALSNSRSLLPLRTPTEAKIRSDSEVNVFVNEVRVFLPQLNQKPISNVKLLFADDFPKSDTPRFLSSLDIERACPCNESFVYVTTAACVINQLVLGEESVTFSIREKGLPEEAHEQEFEGKLVSLRQSIIHLPLFQGLHGMPGQLPRLQIHIPMAADQKVKILGKGNPKEPAELSFQVVRDPLAKTRYETQITEYVREIKGIRHACIDDWVLVNCTEREAEIFELIMRQLVRRRTEARERKDWELVRFSNAEVRLFERTMREINEETAAEREERLQEKPGISRRKGLCSMQ